MAGAPVFGRPLGVGPGGGRGRPGGVPARRSSIHTGGPGGGGRPSARGHRAGACGFHVDDVEREARRVTLFPGWEDLPAVKSGAVWAVDASSYYSRPGPRLVDGMELMARILHPELCGAPDPHRARRVTVPRQRVPGSLAGGSDRKRRDRPGHAGPGWAITRWTSLPRHERGGDAAAGRRDSIQQASTRVSRNVGTDGGTERRAVGQKRLPGWTIVAVVGEPRNTEGRAGVFS
jgi:hypothetical protein